MSFLLDVNVLIALLDQDHVFHARAEDWFEEHAPGGWATCPHSQNGALRILGSARYPGITVNPGAAASYLTALTAYPGHEFWPDEISLISSPIVDPGAIVSAAQVTDTYLLALAARNGGKLATFDRRLSVAAVAGGADALHVIA